MAFQESTTIDHRPAEVFAALVDEGYNRKITKGLGGELIAFERQGELSGPVTLTMVRTVPVSRLPEVVQKFASKFLGDKLRLEQLERWSAPAADGSRTAQLVYNVTSAKVSANIELQLLATGSGSEVQAAGSVECRIPLVGGRVAQAAEPRVGKVLTRQSREVTAWLQGTQGT